MQTTINNKAHISTHIYIVKAIDETIIKKQIKFEEEIADLLYRQWHVE